METSSIEKFKILTKQWAKWEDICRLSGCSRNSAYKIINDIHKQILREGKTPPVRGVAPMLRVIEHLEIDKEEIFDQAMKEKELFGLASNY